MKNMKPISVNPSILNIPSHIISDIFCLLPNKSILSCKLVCKLWCSIIRNPHSNLRSRFISLIVRRDGNNRASKLLHLVQPEADYAIRKREGELCIVLGKEAMITVNKDGYFDGIHVKMMEIVNACNGLVCLSTTSDFLFRETRKKSDWGPFFVCNPVSSDYVVVHQDAPSIELGQDLLEEHSGFGFSDRSKQYKLVRFFSYKKKYVDQGPLIAEVHTVGRDQGWRSISDLPPQDCRWCGKGTLFKGALHWVVVGERKFVTNIVAFDCEEENFTLMAPPSFASQGFDEMPMLELGILESRLCFCFWIYQEMDRSVIWVMDDYGVVESWRKLFAFSTSDPPDFLMPLRPLVYVNNCEILMLSVTNRLVSYDPRSNRWRAIKIPGVTDGMEAMLFDPIFLPIKNILMQGEQPQ